jgi:hypothetical protein
MKKLIVGIATLMMGMATASASMVVDLNGGLDGSSTLFTYGNLNGTATFDGGVLNNAADLDSINNSVSGASGSFTVTWTAVNEADGSNWVFSTAGPQEIYTINTGWGVSSNGVGAGGLGLLSAGEGFLLTFDVSNLALDAGQSLVFSLSTKDDGRDFSIYQRTGTTNGVSMLDVVTVADAFSANVTVDGSNEFAFVHTSGFNLVNGLKIDVVGEGILAPTNLKAIPRDSGAILKWDDDPSGLLDFYTVYRSESPNVTTLDLSTNVTLSTHTDSGLTNGSSYYYAVTATDTNGTESALSDEVSVTPYALSTNTVLLMHYDASDVASVVTNVSGVTTWLNQVGGDTYYPAESTTFASPLYPSEALSASGLAGLDFTTNATQLRLMNAAQTARLLDLTSTNHSGFVVMMALLPETIKANFNSQYIIANTASVNAGFGIRKTNNGFQSWLGSSSGTLNSSPSTGDTVVISFRYDVEDLELSFWESASGNSLTAARDPLDYSTDLFLDIGDYTHSDFDFEGQIFEIKIWESTLDDATLESEQDMMVAKWVGTDAGYNSWAEQWGVDIGASTNDHDNDGVFNIYEYGLSGDPTNETVEPAVLPVLVNTGSGLEYVHVQRNDDVSLVYTIETTENLVIPSWTNSGVTATTTNIGAGLFDTVTNDVNSVTDEKFIRLIIEN